MQNKKAEQIEDIIIEGFKNKFGDKVNNIHILESTDIPYTMISLEFEMYNYFNLRFNYDRGSFGCCIINGKYGIGLKNSQEWFDKADLEIFFEDLKEQIELRIPDKFLEYHGWK